MSNARTYLGAPCRRGHHDIRGKCLRYAGNGGCVQCAEESRARRRTAARQRAIAEPGGSYGGTD